MKTNGCKELAVLENDGFKELVTKIFRNNVVEHMRDNPKFKQIITDYIIAESPSTENCVVTDQDVSNYLNQMVNFRMASLTLINDAYCN